MGDHGRNIWPKEWVSKDAERRSGALAGGGSHPNHRYSCFADEALVSGRYIAGLLVEL
jgi:hypothetical protein